MSALITGGSGFFGEILIQRLLESGTTCVNIDLRPSPLSHPMLRSVKGDISDADLVNRVFSEHCFDVVFHCAAILAHSFRDKRFLWRCNVEGTRVLARSSAAHSVPKLVFRRFSTKWGA
jgi:UDP-glucose 4-epimerase